MNKYTFYVVRNIISGFAIKDNYTGMYLKEVYKTHKIAQEVANNLNAMASMAASRTLNGE